MLTLVSLDLGLHFNAYFYGFLYFVIVFTALVQYSLSNGFMDNRFFFLWWRFSSDIDDKRIGRRCEGWQREFGENERENWKIRHLRRHKYRGTSGLYRHLRIPISDSQVLAVYRMLKRSG